MNKVNIIKVNDYQEMSEKASQYIIDKVKANPKMVLGLATGGTPEGTYKRLIEDHNQNGTSYDGIATFNLDEYVGLSGDHPQSYRHYMNERFFNHIDINKENTYVPRGNTVDAEAECEAYEALMASVGGIDLQILGIGGNGHIGFNEPGTSFQSPTHIVDLAQSTKEANARYFANIDEVPNQAITMGIASIMKSREILLLISGESKHEAYKQLIEGEIKENFPASILRNHPYVTIIADKAAIGE